LSERKISGLLYPTLVAENEKGETVFSLKRKGEKYGQIYYLFEIKWDLMEEETREKFNRAWAVTKNAAANLGIPLFSADEIKAKLRKITPSEGEFGIEVKDHATGETFVLRVGKRGLRS